MVLTQINIFLPNREQSAGEDVGSESTATSKHFKKNVHIFYSLYEAQDKTNPKFLNLKSFLKWQQGFLNSSLTLMLQH